MNYVLPLVGGWLVAGAATCAWWHARRHRARWKL